jgi:phenylpropionate dioxygenase-like ring-hydroxylating dioxygenase large terminal subunit
MATSTRIPLPPYPNGWYAVALSRDVAPGSVHPKHYFGQDIVIYRTQSGVPAMIDAYCPHLGAHLGHGGAIEGETIVCPFHGWKYGPDGVCTAMPYGDRIPPRAALKTWHVREQDDVILAWFDAAGRPPGWEMPPFEHKEPFTRTRAHKFESYASHPYEIMENSADGAHFRKVHKTQHMKHVALPKVDGPFYRITFRSDESVIADEYRVPGQPGGTYEIGGNGPGLSFGVFAGDDTNFRTLSRHYVTPIDGEVVDAWILSQISELDDPAMTEQVADAVFAATISQIEDDIVIWRAKRYLPSPAINGEEAPIMLMRRWYKQFYETA